MRQGCTGLWRRGCQGPLSFNSLGHRSHAFKNPTSPVSVTLVCELLGVGAAQNGVLPAILFVLAPTQPGLRAWHNMGVRRPSGPNYSRVWPSQAGATIGWGGSCERTEMQFASSSRTPGAPWLGRRGFTIRFSFLPDHIDQFTDLAATSRSRIAGRSSCSSRGRFMTRISPRSFRRTTLN